MQQYAFPSGLGLFKVTALSDSGEDKTSLLLRDTTPQYLYYFGRQRNGLRLTVFRFINSPFCPFEIDVLPTHA